MRAIRLQSVRHARGLMRIYRVFEGVIVAIEPLARMIGYGRLEAPVCRVERAVKGLMFDCRMCGQCVLSSTGMSCPMNCPKNLRNGPCGGVREDGGCEVEPDVTCVWLKAWEGAQAMTGDGVFERLSPIDHRLSGSSSWLRVMRAKASAGAARAPAAPGP